MIHRSISISLSGCSWDITNGCYVVAKAAGCPPITGRVIAIGADRLQLKTMIRPLDAANELGAVGLDEYYGELQVLLL